MQQVHAHALPVVSCLFGKLSAELIESLRVWRGGGGLCNEGVQCNKCKISLTLKTKLQAKRRQSSSVRNLADSKETKRTAWGGGCGAVA